MNSRSMMEHDGNAASGGGTPPGKALLSASVLAALMAAGGVQAGLYDLDGSPSDDWASSIQDLQDAVDNPEEELPPWLATAKDEIISDYHGGAYQQYRVVTIEGRLFYNDLRKTGHVDWRRDPAGNVGQKMAYSAGAENWVGAYYVVADIYELDGVDTSAAFPTCSLTEKLGSATVNSRGEYRFTATLPDDDCVFDLDTTPDIGVKFRLRFCNAGADRCFSVENGDRVNYQLWHSRANPSVPLTGTSGTHTLPDGFFRAAPHDNYSMAANHYAGLVEATQIWKVYNDIPFYYDDFGEVFLEFPSSLYDSAKTAGPTRLHFPQPEEWPAGGFHEWGHIIHNRTWEGTTGGCGDCPGGKYNRDGDPNWHGTEKEYPHTALVEGWASFVGVATQYYPDGCGTSFDSNDLSDKPIANADPNEYPDNRSQPVTWPHTGRAYPRNIAKIFCDWYDGDEHDDDDGNMAGYGDTFHATLKSTWSNFENLWDWANGADGLEICDYVDYYLFERKSVANVGTAAHDDYVEWITNLIYNNGVSCNFPRP